MKNRRKPSQFSVSSGVLKAVALHTEVSGSASARMLLFVWRENVLVVAREAFRLKKNFDAIFELGVIL